MITEDRIAARLSTLGLKEDAVRWVIQTAGERLPSKLEGDAWLPVKAPRWDEGRANASAFAGLFYRLAPSLPGGVASAVDASAVTVDAGKLARIYEKAKAKGDADDADPEEGLDAALELAVGAAVSEAVLGEAASELTLGGATYAFEHRQPKAGGRAVARLRDPNAGGDEDAGEEGEGGEEG